MRKARWLSEVRVTEYFPVPERWFVGRRVRAAGLRGKHRIDWLYSARGLSMEGDGVGLDGRRYHIANVGRGGWVAENGRRTRATSRGWRPAAPAWRSSGLWLNRRRGVTFPLGGGGWHQGVGRRYVSPAGIAFGIGPSRPLTYYRSAAVDPKLIPMGSLLYVASHRAKRGGWMRAADVGGAIIGRHIDVYRPSPRTPGGGQHWAAERIYVVPPSAQRNRRPIRLPSGIPPPASGV